jgi:hypothetical protein
MFPEHFGDKDLLPLVKSEVQKRSGINFISQGKKKQNLPGFPPGKEGSDTFGRQPAFVMKTTGRQPV